jgi:hypothetical protein
MANREHIRLLDSEAWNDWRKNNPDVRPDLMGADLGLFFLERKNLAGADLREASLEEALLVEANLEGADLRKASLRGAHLLGARLYNAKLAGANLTGANVEVAFLSGADLSGTDLSGANLRGSFLLNTALDAATLSGADLVGANLFKADLSRANLSGANLNGANLVEVTVEEANFDGCRVYGISAWNLMGTPKSQSNLIFTPVDEPVITVDNLKVAQFIFLLLRNEEVRGVIDTITSKAVLILGRFSPERKVVLDALREELRTRNYLPIIFDFEKPTDRDFTETVLTLAGMSKFIIADLTQPKSSPLESHVTITNYMIPFIPIIQEGDWPFAMFVDLQRKHHWVLKTLKYKDKDDLIQYVDRIIAKANAKYRDIQIEKAKTGEEPVSGDEW